MTLDELFETISAKAKILSVPDSIEKSKILLNIDAKNPRQWLVDFMGDKVELRDYADELPDVTVTLSEDTLIGIATHEKSPTWAFMTGKIRVDGNVNLVKKLSKIWPDK
jgi:putative sterol carrier protein